MKSGAPATNRNRLLLAAFLAGIATAWLTVGLTLAVSNFGRSARIFGIVLLAYAIALGLGAFLVSFRLKVKVESR